MSHIIHSYLTSMLGGGVITPTSCRGSGLKACHLAKAAHPGDGKTRVSEASDRCHTLDDLEKMIG